MILRVGVFGSGSHAVRGMPGPATRAILCWWAGLRSGAVGDTAESDRRGQRLEMIGAQQPKCDQCAFVAEMPPERTDFDRETRKGAGQQPDDGCEKQADAIDTAPDPATCGTGIAMTAGTHAFARRGKAPLRLERRRAVLDGLKRARHPRRHELRKKAERHPCFGAVVPGNPQPGRRLASVGAVAGKPAAAVRMHRATLQLCVPPGLRANVIGGGKVCFVDELHRPSMARRTAIRAGQPHSIDTGRSKWRRIAGTATGNHADRGPLPQRGPTWKEGLPPCPGIIRPPTKPASDQPGKSGPLRVTTIW